MNLKDGKPRRMPSAVRWRCSAMAICVPALSMTSNTPCASQQISTPNSSVRPDNRRANFHDNLNRGVSTASGFASNGLRAFFIAPMPSGCTLMLVRSSDPASILMRTA